MIFKGEFTEDLKEKAIREAKQILTILVSDNP